MKKTMFFVLIFILFCLWNCWTAKAIDPNNIDWKLKFLLNDETDPFFPDTVRKIFVSTAMRAVSVSCKYASTAKDEGWVLSTGNNTSIAGINLRGGQNVWNVLGIKRKDTDYGLLRVRKHDIGLNKIATDQPVKYWYLVGWGTYVPSIGVYNVATGSTAVELYYSTVADWDSSRALRNCFKNEVALYSLYLCYLAKGERDIANFIRQIAINEIMDLKAILENRPVDVTIAKEVVPR